MRVMVFGTFDCLHPGHLNYLQQARGFGDEVIVIVARDSNVQNLKGHWPQENETQRLEHLRAVLAQEAGKFKIVLGAKNNIYLVLKKYQPDIIALGYDQQVNLTRLEEEILKLRFSTRIKRLKPYHPEKYKSSLRR